MSSSSFGPGECHSRACRDIRPPCYGLALMNATEKLGRGPRRRLYLMRHGDVSYFDDDGRPVPPDTVPLNRAGRLQAEAAARELAAVPLDRVIISGLPRTVETAAIVTARRDLQAEARPALAEIRPGRLGDHSAEEVKRM